MKEVFLRLTSRLLKEKTALWVWSQTIKVLKDFQIDFKVWPISFIKGNLTLGTQDSFFIAKFKVIEKEFLQELNKKLKPIKVKKVFYRFSSPREYGPTLKER
ncbi:hypothetical protein J7K05_00475 [bacterium]|nr:hypothetical protein [bacterium]